MSRRRGGGVGGVVLGEEGGMRLGAVLGMCSYSNNKKRIVFLLKQQEK